MPLALPLSRLSPELRISAFYATLWLSMGTATTYLGPWFEQKGFSSEQIGVINAAPFFLLMVLNLVVGRVADRARDWRQVIVAGSVLSALVPFGLIWADGFVAVLLVWTASYLSQSLVAPVTEAASMRVALRRGTSYAGMRAWGTIGFTVGIFLTAWALGVWGPAAFLPLFIALGLLRGIAAFGLPQLRATEDEARRAPPSKAATHLSAVLRPWFLMPLVGWAAIYGTLASLNAFQGLLWARQGIAPETIGNLIGLGAVSEAVVFLAFAYLPLRMSARGLMLISALAAALRWIGMALEPGIGWLIVLQCLHGLTFTVGFLGAMRFIANWTAEDIAAEAQGAFTVLQQGASVIAILVFGRMVTGMGAGAYWGSLGLAIAGAGLIFASMLMRQPKG
jgi:PPP family 3-phenylpropionic acid transporter